MRGQLESYFDAAFTAPNGVKRLRELILTLAVQGKLTEQRASDEPASEFLKKISAEKKKLEKEGKIKKQKPLPPVGEDEKPYTLPKGWEWVRLSSVGEVNPRNKADDSLEAAFIPMASIEAEHSNKHGFEIKSWGEIKKGFTHLGEGDIGLAKITPCFENKKSCVFSGLPNAIGAGTTELHIFRDHCGAFVPQFVLCYLKTPKYIQSAAAHMTGTAGQQRVPTDFFASFPVPLPPLAEQQRIVEHVSALMARCDVLETMHKEQEHKRKSAQAAAMHALTMPQGSTDPTFAFSRNWGFLARHFEQLFTTKQDVAELRKTILQLAVMGKITEQRASDEPASEFLKKISAEKKKLEKEGKIKKQKPLPPVGEDEKPYTLPKGWEWVRLGEIAKLVEYGTSQKTHTDDSCVPVYRMGNIFNGDIVNTNFKYIDRGSTELPRLFLKKHDILFNRTNSIELVGKSAVYYGEDDSATFASYLIRVRLLLQFIDIKFISISMNSNYYKQTQINTAVTQQCGQANFNGTKLGYTLLPLPPLAEQQRIVERVNALMALCDTLENNMAARTQTQTCLLDAVVAIA